MAKLASRRWLLFGAACLCSTMWPAIVCGQTPPQPESSSGAYTLHVYTDLLEVPTIVQTPLHSSLRSLTKQSFLISLGGGPDFHPTSLRVEGDDPIALGVLFDGTTVAPEMLRSFATTMAQLPRGLLSERDSISVYAYDCELVRIAAAEPAGATELRNAMNRASARQFGRSAAEKQKSCSRANRLFDATARVVGEMGSLPGRRVLLVLSKGTDLHSVNSWLDVARYAESKSVAIFSLRPVRPVAPQFKSPASFDLIWVTSLAADPMGSLCASTGGMILKSDSSTSMIAAQIRRMMTMLRERYILGFPRPENGTPGDYAIAVKVDEPEAIIRPTGVEFPPRASDPSRPESTVPEDRSRMPVVGSTTDFATPK